MHEGAAAPSFPFYPVIAASKQLSYDITIWDICNKAKAYRSTFYRYFDTKDEMLREIEREYMEKTRSLTPTIHH